MMPPLISCIVPVFNGEAYLREALQSILDQTWRPLEVIVVDDGSTDRTPDVVRACGPEVRYLYQLNAGPAAARNLGLSVAQGGFVAFLDADDIWHPEKLSRQMDRFRARPEIGICVTHVRNFWSPDLPAEQRLDDACLIAPWVGNTCASLLARRAVFGTVGTFDPALRLGEDGDWFLRAAERAVVREVLPEVLVYRRLHAGNLTRRLAAASREHLLDRLRAHLHRCRGH